MYSSLLMIILTQAKFTVLDKHHIIQYIPASYGYMCRMNLQRWVHVVYPHVPSSAHLVISYKISAMSQIK